MSRILVFISFTWAAHAISSIFHVATAFPAPPLLHPIFRSERINLSNKRISVSESKSHLPLVLICHKSWWKASSVTPITALGVQVFHPDTSEPAVVVSSLYWDNIKSKILTVIGVEFVVIVIGIILLGSFVNQLPKFLSDLAKSEEKNGMEEDLGLISAKSLRTFKSPSINISKLLGCLIIDSIGTISVAVPLLGEISDVIWAPIAATALRSIYGGSNVIFALEFLEEILPFTDVIPLATLCWVIESFYADSDLAKLLRIGQFASQKSLLTDVKASTNQSLDDLK